MSHTDGTLAAYEAGVQAYLATSPAVSPPVAGFLDRHLRRGGWDARLLDVRSGDLGGPYDGVYANAVLLHLDRAALAAAPAACWFATRPGGVLAFTVKEGEGEAWSEAKLGLPRWFVYWQAAGLRAVIEAVGWQVESLEQVAGAEPWLHVVCSRVNASGGPVDNQNACG